MSDDRPLPCETELVKASNGDLYKKPPPRFDSGKSAKRKKSAKLRRFRRLEELREKDNEEARQRASELAKPRLLLTKNTQIVQHVLKHLPYASLLNASEVCTLWYQCAQVEKKKREFLEVDTIVLELKHDNEFEHTGQFDTDMKVELDEKFSESFTVPNQVLAFMTWHPLTDIPEHFFRVLPNHCQSTVVGSQDGVIATDRKSQAECHIDEKLECLTTLYFPKYERVKILPFAAKNFRSLSFREFFFDNIGLRDFELKKQIKCILVFVSRPGHSLNDPNTIRQTVFRDLRRDFHESFGEHTGIFGSAVGHCDRGTQKTLQKNESASAVHGLIFCGQNVDIHCEVLDRANDKHSKIGKIVEKFESFYKDSGSNRFILLLTGLCADFDGEVMKTLKKTFSKIPVVGIRSSGHVFGSPFHSESPEDKTKVLGNELYVGDYVVIVGFKFRKFYRQRKEETLPKMRRGISRYVRVK